MQQDTSPEEINKGDENKNSGIESNLVAPGYMGNAIESGEALRQPEEGYRLKWEEEVKERFAEHKKDEQQIMQLKDEIALHVKDKYLKLFNTIDEAVVWCELIVDENGKAVDYRMLELNAAFEKISGISLETIKGKTAKEFAPEAEDWWLETYAKVALEEKSVRFEKKVENKWFEFYASPVGYKKDRQFVVVYKNVTERKNANEALQQNEKRLRIILEAAVDFAIINTNTKGLIESWSSGAEKIFGFTAEEMKGKPANVIFTEEDQANSVPEKEMATAREKGRAEDERWHKRKDGSRFYASGVMRPVYNPELIGYVKVARDMTQQKLLEQQKDDFISIASHELRTPVTSIKSYAELAEAMYHEGDYENGALVIKKLNEQVERFTDLIKMLLDMTKITEGKLSLNKTSFDLEKLITECIEESQPTPVKHKLLQANKAPLFVYADRERIKEVITNLISNALKYSPAESTIVISSLMLDNAVQVSVEDKGLGIPKEQLNKIFERFYRVRNATIDTFPGMGLGLYISASIIQQHHGKIWVESEINKGSTFYFTLPVKKEPNQ